MIGPEANMVKRKNRSEETESREAVQLSGCEEHPGAPEEEEKDDGRGQSFRQRDEEITGVISHTAHNFRWL